MTILMKIGRFHFSVHALIRFNERCPDLVLEDQVKTATIIGSQRSKVISARLSRHHRRTDSIMFVTKDEAIFVCLRDRQRFLVVTVIQSQDDRNSFIDGQVKYMLDKNKNTDDNELPLVKAVREKEYLDTLESCPIYQTLKMEASRVHGYMTETDLYELRTELLVLYEAGEIKHKESIELYRKIDHKISYALERQASSLFDFDALKVALDSGCYLFEMQFVYLRRGLAAGDFRLLRGVDDHDSARSLIRVCAERTTTSIEEDRYDLIEASEFERVIVTLGNLAKLLPEDASFFDDCELRVKGSNLSKRRNAYIEYANGLESAWAETLPEFQPLVMPKVAESQEEIERQIDRYSFFSRVIKLLSEGAKHPPRLTKLVKILNTHHADGLMDLAMFDFLIEQVYISVDIRLRDYYSVQLPSVYRCIKPSVLHIDLCVGQLSRAVKNIQDGNPIRLSTIEGAIETVTTILENWSLSEEQLCRVYAVERIYRMLRTYCLRNDIEVVCVSDLIGESNDTRE